MKHPSQPVQILEKEWLIQSQLMTERIDFYLAHHNIFIPGNHLTHRIPRRQHDQTERDKADAQKNQHHFSQPQGQLFLSQIPPSPVSLNENLKKHEKCKAGNRDLVET